MLLAEEMTDSAGLDCDIREVEHSDIGVHSNAYGLAIFFIEIHIEILVIGIRDVTIALLV